jgi:hypothetical protein
VVVYCVGFVLRISDGPITCILGVAVNAVCKGSKAFSVISEDVMLVMVYKFNLSVSIGLPVGEVISCREFIVCFTSKDVLLDMIWEIVSCSGIDLNKCSGVVWVKWMFQLSRCDTGVKAFEMGDLLLLTIGEACL